MLGRRVGLAAETAGELAAAVAELAGRAEDWFREEAVPDADREVELVFDARYVGQNFELRVPVAAGPPTVLDGLPGSGSIAGITARFFEVHDVAYGYHNPDDPVEVVNVRLTAFGRTRRDAAVGGAAGPAAPPVPDEVRPVWFDPHAPVDTPVFDRSRLRPGAEITGPAVVEQLDATTVVHPGDRARVDTHANLTIALDGG